MVVTAQKRESPAPLGFAMKHSSPDLLRVLVVDDDKVDRMSLSRILKKSDYDAALSEAADAETALRMVEETSFDCVFVDYELPGRNGLEFIRIVRDRGVYIPVIALTGQGNEQTAVDLMKAGASDYLTKSKLSVDVVEMSIRGALRVHQAEMIAIRANLDLREKNVLLEQQNKELEKQRHHIHKQNLQLQEAFRLKSEFLAMMSHELRTPLNAIIGFSQILMSDSKGLLDKTHAKMVSRVLANGKNLLALINDILDFSKIEAGRLGLEPEKLDLAALIHTTVDELQSLGVEKNLSVHVELDLDNPIVTNDAVRMRQILVNLLSNAIKFTEEGSIVVGAKAANESTDNKLPTNNDSQTSYLRKGELIGASSEDDFIVITVKDTGCGIDKDSLDYIFDPFHQVDQQLTRQHGGTGLGLAIVNSLVNMMCGSVTVQSQLHQGTTISIIIPRKITAV